MPPRQNCPKPLPFLLYATLSLKSKQLIWEPFHSEDNTVYHTPVSETLEKANFPQSGSLPAHQRLKASGGQTGTQFALSLMVAKQLDQLSRGVQEVYNTAIRGAKVSAQWWLSVDTYSGDRNQVLKYLWGNNVFRMKDKKARDQARPKLEKLLREVEKLLGADSLKGSDKAASKFSTSMFLTALRKLTTASKLLGWEVLLPTDYTALEAACPNWTPDKNQAFFDSLTPQAQTHKKNKGSKAQAVLYDVEEDLKEYVLAGYVVAADVMLFAEELYTFATEWQQWEHVPLTEDILKMLAGGENGLQEWLDGGDDLGVEHHAKLTDIQLEMQDGYSPVAKDPAFYQPRKDEPIDSKIVPLKLCHHQRVAVAVIYQKIINTQNFLMWPAKPRNLPGNALLALHKNWVSVLGCGVWDTVSLGKTWMMVLVIVVSVKSC
ncbi:hypothetical protein DFH08DRAFT_820088 [Mycena albidolilacea]|uniref:Uncharacterized protein n=1 Tax=Mycena albidolilacea TaxID=1033008 RepID=A0AAD7EFF9_9AGAR|nr:hypothetical protein DFH08DRAFT_820088 [Mycena albidolilacea]